MEAARRVAWMGRSSTRWKEAQVVIEHWRVEYNTAATPFGAGIQAASAAACEIGGKRAVEKTLRGKPKAGFPLRLEIPQTTRDSHFPTASRRRFIFVREPRIAERGRSSRDFDVDSLTRSGYKLGQVRAFVRASTHNQLYLLL